MASNMEGSTLVTSDRLNTGLCRAFESAASIASMNARVM
jgi:hypothetical protein